MKEKTYGIERRCGQMPAGLMHEGKTYFDAMRTLTDIADRHMKTSAPGRLLCKEAMLLITGGSHEWPEWYKGEGWYLGERLVFRRTVSNDIFTAFGDDSLTIGRWQWKVVETEER